MKHARARGVIDMAAYAPLRDPTDRHVYIRH